MSSGGQADNEHVADGRGLVFVICCALVVRIGVIVIFFDDLQADPDGYRTIAESIAGEHTFGYGETPTAYRPPLYPMLLSACVAVGTMMPWAIAACHVVLGVGTAVLVWRLAWRAGLGKFSVLAGLLVAFDPILVNQSVQVMTETLATFLAALALVSLIRLSRTETYKQAILAGVCLGLATLCRPVFLVWTVFVLGVLVVRGTPLRKRIATAGVVLIAFAIVLAPWVVRNQITFSRPIIATTHGGYTLLLGNNPYFYEHLDRQPWGAVWDADEFAEEWRRGLPDEARRDETVKDRLAYERAFANIRAAPGMFLDSSLVRIGRLWSPLPHKTAADESTSRRWMRYVVMAWYLAEYLLVGWGIYRLGRRLRLAPWVWGLLLAAALTLVHAVYWSNLRMRAPAMPVVALFCAAGAADVWSRFAHRKS